VIGMLMTLAAMLIMLFSSAFLHPSHARSRDVPRQFQKEHPCPSTGRKWGACPGYVRDHIKPLCAGGADATWNMQWQTTKDARAKDYEERRECRRQ